VDLGAFLGGLGTFLEKLSELAEKGEELRKTGEIRGLDSEGKLRGIYGFNVKVGLGEEGVNVEPFGNVRKDEETGTAVVHEVREPMVDVVELAAQPLHQLELLLGEDHALLDARAGGEHRLHDAHPQQGDGEDQAHGRDQQALARREVAEGGPQSLEQLLHPRSPASGSLRLMVTLKRLLPVLGSFSMAPIRALAKGPNLAS